MTVRTSRPVVGWKALLAILLFSLIGVGICALPDNLADFHASAFLHLPIEVPMLSLALLLLPKRIAVPIALLATILLACLLFLKVADMGVLLAFQRRFNPYLDIKMMFDGWNVLSGTLGTGRAALLTGAAAIAFGGLVVVFLWACLQLTRLGRPARRAGLSAFAIVLGLGIVSMAVSGRQAAPDFAGMPVAPYLAARMSLVTGAIANQRQFEHDVAADKMRVGPRDLFSKVKGHDVILVFIESYGRSALEDSRYRPVIGPRLDRMEHQLQAAGFAAASGWTLSPTVGGLSWLAHGTLLSGLWIDSQPRYDLLMESGRPSLNRMFHDAGWETSGVMPAITMDWPESAYYGYDRVLAEKDLGYRGKPFNWVTMPDQYTLSAFERLVRAPARAEGKNVMAQVVLISSHAPWTPVPVKIDWNAVGDGTVFNGQAESGDPPQVVWSDQDRVRRQYIATIDYSLDVLGDYIAGFGSDAVFVVLGDHQPAEIVTGPNASRAVPIHIVSRDRQFVEAFMADGFAAGMSPSVDGAIPTMDRMRDILIRRFSGE